MNIILWITEDTDMWIKKIKKHSTEEIIIVDYDLNGEKDRFPEVILLSPDEAKTILGSKVNLKFYKSMYIYPTII